MAELAAVAARAHQRAPVDEDTAADTDVTGEVDHSAAIARTAAHLLGEHAEIRVIADGHVTASAAESITQEFAEGHIGPAEVGREAHKTIGRAYDARHAGAYADKRCAGRERLHDPTAHLDNLIQESLAIPAAVSSLLACEDLAAQTDERSNGALDSQIQGEDRNRSGDRLHDKRRPTHTADVSCTLAHEAERGERAHEVTHRAAIEPGDRGEMRARLGPSEVQQAQHRGQV
jgi:hypothetical protein